MRHFLETFFFLLKTSIHTVKCSDFKYIVQRIFTSKHNQGSHYPDQNMEHCQLPRRLPPLCLLPVNTPKFTNLSTHISLLILELPINGIILYYTLLNMYPFIQQYVDLFIVCNNCLFFLIDV